MTCTCDYDGMPDVFDERMVVARKKHRCCECYTDINPGDVYERIKGLWDGEWSTYKTCERCSDLRNSIAAVSCPEYSGLRDAYFEYLQLACQSEEDWPINHMTRDYLNDQ